MPAESDPFWLTVRLVVIDPLSAFPGGRGSLSGAAVRAMLAPLAKVARRRRVAVVMVTHLSKGPGLRKARRLRDGLGRCSVGCPLSVVLCQ